MASSSDDGNRRPFLKFETAETVRSCFRAGVARLTASTKRVCVRRCTCKNEFMRSRKSFCSSLQPPFRQLSSNNSFRSVIASVSRISAMKRRGAAAKNSALPVTYRSARTGRELVNPSLRRNSQQTKHSAHSKAQEAQTQAHKAQASTRRRRKQVQGTGKRKQASTRRKQASTSTVHTQKTSRGISRAQAQKHTNVS